MNKENEVFELEKKILKLLKEKRKLWRIIPVAILLPTIGPFIPMRRGMLADRMGYQNAALMLFILCLLIIPIAWYLKLQKINNDIFDLEYDLENLKTKSQQKT